MDASGISRNASDALVSIFEKGYQFNAAGIEHLRKKIGNDKVVRIILKVFAPFHQTSLIKASPKSLTIILKDELLAVNTFKKNLNNGSDVKEFVNSQINEQSSWDPVSIQEKTVAKIIYYLTLYPIPALAAQQQKGLFQTPSIQTAIQKHESKCVMQILFLFQLFGPGLENHEIPIPKLLELEKFIVSHACFLEKGKYLSWIDLIKDWGKDCGADCLTLQVRFFQVLKLYPFLTSSTAEQQKPKKDKKLGPVLLKKEDLKISSDKSFQKYLASRTLQVILVEHLSLAIPEKMEKEILSIFQKDDESRRCALSYTFHLKSRLKMALETGNKDEFHEKASELLELTLTSNPSSIQNFLNAAYHFCEIPLYFKFNELQKLNFLFECLYSSNEKTRIEFRKQYLLQPHVICSGTTLSAFNYSILEKAIETLFKLEMIGKFSVPNQKLLSFIGDLCAYQNPEFFLEFIQNLKVFRFTIDEEFCSDIVHKMKSIPNFDLSKFLEGICWYKHFTYLDAKDPPLTFTKSHLLLFQENTFLDKREKFINFFRSYGSLTKYREQDFIDGFLHFAQGKVTKQIVESMILLSEKLQFPLTSDFWLDIFSHQIPDGIPSAQESYLQFHMVVELKKYALTSTQYGLLFLESFNAKKEISDEGMMSFEEHWKFIHELENFINSTLPKDLIFNLLFCHCLIKKSQDFIVKLEKLRISIITDLRQALALPSSIESDIWETSLKFITEAVAQNSSRQNVFFSYQQKEQQNIISNHLSTIVSMLSFSIFLPKNLLLPLIPNHDSTSFIPNQDSFNYLHPLVSAYKESKAMVGQWKSSGKYPQLDLTIIKNLSMPISITTKAVLKIDENLWKEHPDLWNLIAKAVAWIGLDHVEPLDKDRIAPTQFGNPGEEFDFYLNAYPGFLPFWEEWSDSKKPSDVLMIKLALFSFVKTLKVSLRNALIILSQKIDESPSKKIREAASRGNVYQIPQGLSLIPCNLLDYTFNPAFMIQRDEYLDMLLKLVHDGLNNRKSCEIELKTVIQSRTLEELLIDVKINLCPFQKKLFQMVDDDDILRNKELEYHDVTISSTWMTKTFAYQVKYPATVSEEELPGLLQWQLLLLKSEIYQG